MASRDARPEAPRPRRGASGGFQRTLQLFGEVALTGVLVAVGSLLLVTFVPSLAAGVAHLRRDIHGRPATMRRFAVEWWGATKALWPLGLATVGLAVLLAGDWQLARSGVLPGGQIVALVVAVFAAGVLVVGFRAAGAWSDDEGEPSGRTARQALGAGSDRAMDDLAGSALLLGALAMAVVIVWMLPLLGLVVGGLLALAVVGVELRVPRAAA
jgi:hypothetical protein